MGKMGRNHHENEREKQEMKTTNTALDALLQARREDVGDIKSLDFFSFSSHGIDVDYHGRYFGYFKRHDAKHYEGEFGASSFDGMLDCRIDLTGKTVREMLSELDAADISIDQSDFRRSNPE